MAEELTDVQLAKALYDLRVALRQQSFDYGLGTAIWDTLLLGIDRMQTGTVPDVLREQWIGLRADVSGLMFYMPERVKQLFQAEVARTPTAERQPLAPLPELVITEEAPAAGWPWWAWLLVGYGGYRLVRR